MRDTRLKLAILRDGTTGTSFYGVICLSESGAWCFHDGGDELPEELVVDKYCDLEAAGSHLEDEEYDGRFKWNAVGI